MEVRASRRLTTGSKFWNDSKTSKKGTTRHEQHTNKGNEPKTLLKSKAKLLATRRKLVLKLAEVKLLEAKPKAVMEPKTAVKPEYWPDVRDTKAAVPGRNEPLRQGGAERCACNMA